MLILSAIQGRRFAASVASLLALVAAPSAAFAQDALPPLATPPAPAAAPATPAAEPAPVAAPAPVEAAAAAPSSGPIPITATCSLGDHFGIEESEARTGASLVCDELAKLGATNTAYEVRFGKLGGKTLVTVATGNGNVHDERRTLLTGLDELPVAAPRLAGALAEGRTMEQTKNVDNVLESEARRSKVEPGQMGFEMGVFGATTVGQSSGASGGVGLALLYRAGNLAISSHGRAGGIGSSDSKIGLATLDVGARAYLTNTDTAPFVGAGVGLFYIDLSRKTSSIDGSGMGGFAEAGVEMLRSHHASLAASLRIDAPFFALGSGDQSRYAAPLSLNLGLLFH